MLLSVVCCVLLGVALAKPPPPAQAYGLEPRQEPRPVAVGSDPVPLPARAERASYVLEEGEYQITSRGYEENRRYPNYEDERWTLTGDQGQAITIGCLDFNVEYEDACGFDFLQINGEKYCGTDSVADVTSTELQIRFFTDYSVRRSGFYCLITVSGGDGGGGGGTTTTTTTQAPSGDQCCGVPNRATRIVGGVQTEVNEYPWQVALVSTGEDEPFCGGTVINNQWVMTAAHCTAGSSFQVLLRKHILSSDSSQMRMSVARVVDHPSYNSRTMSNDFSLLKLSTTINFSALNNKVAPACLPSGGDFVDVDAIVSGWGTTSAGGSQPSKLREVTVQTMSNAECKNDLGDRKIDATMICADVDAGGKDSCQGDSGGPLVTAVSGRYTLIGVVSWGYGCGGQDSPGVYSRMTSVSAWIAQTTAGASLC